MRRTLFAGALAVAALFAAAAAAAAQDLRGEDLLHLVTVESVRAAPGGDAIAAGVTVPDIVADSRHHELRIVTRAATAGTRLADASFPAWSADGATLFFVRNRKGVVTAESFDRRSGRSRVLAKLPFGPAELSWSPSRTRLAYYADVPAAPRFVFHAPATGAAAQVPVVIQHAPFRSDDGTFLPASERRLFVADLRTGQARLLPLPNAASLAVTEAGDGGPPAWYPDERTILVSAARGFDAPFNLWNVNRDILRIDVGSGHAQWIAEKPGIEKAPAVSPDGRYLAFLRQRGNPADVVYFCDLVVRDQRTGREVTPLAQRDVDIDSFAWQPRDGGLVVRYLEDARYTLARVSRDGRERILSRAVAFRTEAADVAADGTVAFSYSDAHTPPEAATIDSRGAQRIWTTLNAAIAPRGNPILFDITYKSAHADGRPISALVSRPRSTRDPRTLPVIVDLHGGPYSASTRDFDPDRTYFAAQGYVVVQPNYRGSWGYGAAFAKLSDRKHYPGRVDSPTDPGEMGLDVVGALKAIKDLKLGDPRRVFLRGISAGALLTSWTIGRSDGFRAAASQSWYPGEWSAPYYGFFQLRRYFNGLPWDDAHGSEYWRRSVLSMTGRIHTPLLIIQGASDWYTPEMEAEKFYYALRSRGLDVALAVFPGETHAVRRHPASHLNSLAMEVQWFRAHDPAAR